MGRVAETLAPDMYSSPLEELFEQLNNTNKPRRLTLLQQLNQYLQNADDEGIPFGSVL